MYKQLTRTAYGYDNAKDIEYKLEQENKAKDEVPVRKITVRQLYDEYVKVKEHEVRELTLYKTKNVLKRYVLSFFEDCYIDKLTVSLLQEWKLSISKTELALITKQNIYKEFRTMLNYAVKVDYILVNPLPKVGNFKDALAYKPEIKFYTPKEFRKYIEIAKKEAKKKQKQEKNYYEWNYYVFFNIAYYMGLRKR